jgi:hypothetical protein
MVYKSISHVSAFNHSKYLASLCQCGINVSASIIRLIYPILGILIGFMVVKLVLDQ